MPSKLRIQSALMCDDARTEDNGTTFLIGVYSGDMIIHRPPPVAINQAFWMHAETLSDDPTHLEFRGVIDGKTVFHGKTQVRKDAKDKIVTLTLGKRAFKIEESCSLFLQVKEKGGRWRKVMRQNFVIRQGPSNA